MLSYASTYVEADRAAARYLTDPTYKILHNLVSRADEYGICWPGIRTIGEDTAKCKDTVQAALDELERTGCIAYIRRNVRDPISKQKLPNIYQINPCLYAVRPGLQAQAEACWSEHGGKSLSFQLPSKWHNHNITNASKPKSGTTYLNQQQQKPLESERSLSFTPPPSPRLRQASPPAQPDEREKTDEYFDWQPADASAMADKPTYANASAGKPGAHGPERPRPNSEAHLRQSYGGQAGQQRSRKPEFRRSNTKSSKSDVEKVRTSYPDIKRVAEEFSNQPDEWLADRARRETSMSIRFARGLILEFSAPKVEAALNDNALRGSTSIKNKAGYVFWLLTNNLVEINAAAYGAGRPDDPDGSRYATGKYADFIEH